MFHWRDMEYRPNNLDHAEVEAKRFLARFGRTIARSITLKNRGEGYKADDVRRMARVLELTVKQFKSLIFATQRLRPGKQIKVLAGLYDFRVGTTKTADGNYLFGGRIQDAIRHRNLVESHEDGRGYCLRGSIQDIDFLFTLVDAVNEALQEAYNSGLRHGRNLLFGLARGDVSITEFNRKSVAGDGKEV